MAGLSKQRRVGDLAALFRHHSEAVWFGLISEGQPGAAKVE